MKWRKGRWPQTGFELQIFCFLDGCESFSATCCCYCCFCCCCCCCCCCLEAVTQVKYLGGHPEYVLLFCSSHLGKQWQYTSCNLSEIYLWLWKKVMCSGPCQKTTLGNDMHFVQSEHLAHTLNPVPLFVRVGHCVPVGTDDRIYKTAYTRRMDVKKSTWVLIPLSWI